MKTLKGPGIFLAQFIGTEPPFDRLETMAKWVAGLGYVGVQMPTGGADSFFNLELAAEARPGTTRSPAVRLTAQVSNFDHLRLSSPSIRPP